MDLSTIEHQRDYDFQNWSGSITCRSLARICPRDEQEVAELVRRAADEGVGVRPVGSGHSSTPITATEAVMVSLDKLAGVVDHDAEAGLATVLPGTGLEELGSQLAERGLALPNLGDVDCQAIAGAIGTGTHGTGQGLANLSSFLVGGRLVNGQGDIVEFGLDAGEGDASDLTRAAQVSLGSLGILTSLTMRVRPAFELHRRNIMTHIDWVLEHFDELAATYRHVDFYWYPRADLAQVRILDEPGVLDAVDAPGWVKRETRGASYEILPNHREIRFEEMEYMLPRDEGLHVFREVRERIKQRHRREVAWRVLVRTVAPDGAMLSNCQDRPTMTIALLHNADLPYEHYFGDIEPLFLGHGGRPHWGKKHTCLAETLRDMYPEWELFQSIRRQLDPAGTYLNDYLRDLLGEETH